MGTPGTVWFKTATPFEYFNDPNKTKEARSPDGSMSTVGDVGYVDGDGFLHLTDRATFMIISGGVNIYPQECENLLITHPKIADAAVFGVPNADLGEEVKAVVQPMPGYRALRGAGPGADFVLRPIAVAPESAALDRLRGGAAAAADRKALQAAVARPLLGRQAFKDRVKISRVRVDLPLRLQPRKQRKIMTKTSKVRSVEILACDAGWRNYHFVKISTEDGVVGWSEYRRGLWRARRRHRDPAAVRPRGRAERVCP